ncbi:MAG: Gfo/Idh/MocA family oxidoreductase [Verrucomicrobia bacterium]|nr:Gfo/Idh/MocA family oxidoreductase [Verrucomicrobiota bacterium]
MSQEPEPSPSSKQTANISRRRFLAAAGGALAAPMIVPASVLGQNPPSSKLNVAFIGCGGRGTANLSGLSEQNFVAFCDVDTRRCAAALKKHPEVKLYRDFRRMLDEKGKEIDAVAVSTPDHTHAVAAMAAIKRGKHVYCEKPLAHSIGEVRALMAAARRHKVVTQLGNQGHSSEHIRLMCEWIWDGAIGNVHTIHAVSRVIHCKIELLPQLSERPPVPPELDWDQWLGPAKARPYQPLYVPNTWRGWSAFGCGAIGDWVCHVVDPSFWALDLGAPATIQAQAKDYDPKKHGETFPAGSIVTYEFPAKGKRGPVKLVWFDGAEKPPRPADMDPEKEDKVPETGAIIMGDKGTLVHGSHGAGGLHLIPWAKMSDYKQRLPEKKLPRVRNHHQDWLDAIKEGRQAGSNFDYGGLLTEIALLGIIAIKFLGRKLEWDAQKMKFTNCREANQFINPPYRAGWSL